MLKFKCVLGIVPVLGAGLGAAGLLLNCSLSLGGSRGTVGEAHRDPKGCAEPGGAERSCGLSETSRVETSQAHPSRAKLGSFLLPSREAFIGQNHQQYVF